MSESVLELAGIPIRALSPASAIDWICQAAPLKSGRDVHLLSSHGVWVAQYDPEFLHALQSAGAVLPDGKWVARSGRWLGTPLQQVRGPQLFRDVLDRGRARQLRHFFLAPNENCRLKLAARVQELYPGIHIAGSAVATWPNASAAQVAEQDRLIRETHPDIVWLGIATPRQDLEAARLAHSIPATIVAAGAALDFLAGTQAEAPVVWRTLGLEWLYRLGTDPKRLLKRYTIGNAAFVKAVVRQKIRQRQSR